MSVEKTQRVYQRFFPELREELGIKDRSVVGIDPQRFSEPIESLDIPSKFKNRIQRVAAQRNIHTLGDLFTLDLNNPPPELGRKSIQHIQAVRDQITLIEEPEEIIEKTPTDTATLLPLHLLIDRGIFPPDFPQRVLETEREIKHSPQEYNEGLDSFFQFMSGRGLPLNIEHQERGESVKAPEGMTPFVVRILFNHESLGLNLLYTWGEPLYEEVQQLYERQKHTLDKVEFTLPFTWLWSDFYYYRGIWFWKGKPGEDQSDNDLPTDIVYEAIHQSSVFRLEPPPGVETFTRNKTSISPIEHRGSGRRRLDLPADEIVQRYVKGHESSIRLASDYDVSTTAIRTVLHKRGIQLRSPGYFSNMSPEEFVLKKEEIIGRYLAGESSCNIAKSYDVGQMTVLAWLRDWGTQVRKRGVKPKQKIDP